MTKPKVKRMSDVFASSSEHASGTSGVATATPPYSSEGPTLPILEGAAASARKSRSIGKALEDADKQPESLAKKRKITSGDEEECASTQEMFTASFDPLLSQPWKLLPPSVFQLANRRPLLWGAQNVVPIVFTKNQDIRTAVNRLKTYLGNHSDPTSAIRVPEALRHDDAVIAVSAQGVGTTKLVSIIDIARRVVAPVEKGLQAEANAPRSGSRVETWYMYISLSNIVAARKEIIVKEKEMNTEGNSAALDEEDEAFEPVKRKESAGGGTGMGAQARDPKRVPVLTVWLTKRNIATFKDAFGESSFPVATLQQEEE